MSGRGLTCDVTRKTEPPSGSSIYVSEICKLESDLSIQNTSRHHLSKGRTSMGYADKDAFLVEGGIKPSKV